MKIMFSLAICLMAVTGFAAVNDALLTFSTQGPDTYADGMEVLDGECYALVWTRTGTKFAGLKANGVPVADTDVVVLVAPVADGGRCPTIVYQIPAAVADELASRGGSYGVYLLDTRYTAADGEVRPVGVDANGKLVQVNAQAAVGVSTKTTSAGMASMVATKAIGGGGHDG